MLRTFTGNIFELAQLCVKTFFSQDVPYNPYLFLLLDERTERDHSGCLIHHTVDPSSGRIEVKQMRVSASFAPLLLSNLEIAHLDIPGITDSASEAIDASSLSDRRVTGIQLGW